MFNRLAGSAAYCWCTIAGDMAEYFQIFILNFLDMQYDGAVILTLDRNHTMSSVANRFSHNPYRHFSRFFTPLAFGLLISVCGGVSADELGIAPTGSDVVSFDTVDGGPEAVSGYEYDQWLEHADGELPLGGIFYGNHMIGVGAQNSTIAYESSRKFRAERTGFLHGVRFQNRVLTNGNIRSRCETHGAGSTWCNCVDAGLDEYSCGYTLGSSYHVGNGGTLVIELQTDDGNGFPSGEVLDYTDEFVPMENRKVAWPVLEFNRQANIDAGQIYHLVYTNLDPPSRCALSHVPVSEAARCPRDQGAFGINGVRMLSAPSTTGLRGPYLGDEASANLFRRSADSGWSVYTDALSHYELEYVDGVAVGESYSALESTGVAKKKLTPRTLARQIFTVQDASRVVDGLWLNFGHGKTANGSSLRVRLYDNNDKLLATGEIGASEHCREMVNNQSIHLSHWCQDWGYTDLSESVDLEFASTYYVTFVPEDSGAGFILSAVEPLNLHGFKDRNYWSDSRAEVSKDSGRSWGDWTQLRSSERDLPVLFTIEGMPKQIARSSPF